MSTARWVLSARLRFASIAFVLAVLLHPSPSAAASDATVTFDVESAAYGESVRVPINHSNYPRLAIDRGEASPRRGTMYVLTLTNLTCADIQVSRSLDGGQSFSVPTVSTGQCLRGPSLDVLVAPDGTLYVATWGPQVLRSTDGGLSWELLATLGDEGNPSVLALTPGGTLYLLSSSGFWGPAPAGAGVNVSVSQDGGRNWTSPSNVLPPGISGTSAQIAATNSKAVVAFVGRQGSDEYVAVVNSTDSGATWGAETRLSTPFHCAWTSAPSIAVAQSDVFAVSWYFEPATSPSGCWDNWGSETEVRVATWGEFGVPLIARMSGPGWATTTFGDAIAFDDQSRVYVTWHSIAPGWSNASVLVAAGGTVGSLSTTLRVPGGNSTQQENLAAGLGGSMWLAWTVVNHLDPTDPRIGTYVRRVAGGAVLQISGTEAEVPLAVELRGEFNASYQASWSGTPVNFADVPPGKYDVRVGTNQSALPTKIPVHAFGLTTITIRFGTEPSPFPWFAVLAFAASAVAGGAVLVMLVRRRRQR